MIAKDLYIIIDRQREKLAQCELALSEALYDLVEDDGNSATTIIRDALNRLRGDA